PPQHIGDIWLQFRKLDFSFALIWNNRIGNNSHFVSPISELFQFILNFTRRLEVSYNARRVRNPLWIELCGKIKLSTP
ncbi:hypothetical protein, partial [Neisseria chenwenguii]|uniref:hypothetical protein n=1 Tax=Neisseria chenwenguii TaxID=1853278 RepID=UPI001F2DB6AC